MFRIKIIGFYVIFMVMFLFNTSGSIVFAKSSVPVYLQTEILSDRYDIVKTDICGSEVVIINRSGAYTDPIGDHPISIDYSIVNKLIDMYGSDLVNRYVYKILVYNEYVVAYVYPGAPKHLIESIREMLPAVAEKYGVNKSMIVVLDLFKYWLETEPWEREASKEVFRKLKSMEPIEKYTNTISFVGYNKDLGVILVQVSANYNPVDNKDMVLSDVETLLRGTGLCGVPVLVENIPVVKLLPTTANITNNETGIVDSDIEEHGTNNEPAANVSGGGQEIEDNRILLASAASIFGALLVLLVFLNARS